LEVPISVFPPSPFIIFTPYLDFGYVELEKISAKSITFKNEGIKRGEVHFITKELKFITIEPNILFLEPEEERNVEFRFRST
jgi:hypothetical protein